MIETTRASPTIPQSALPAPVPRPNSPSRSAPPPPFLRPIVFLGGLSSIGIELAASRLIAPYFGSSTFIWANLIGVTLAFLS
ncbi:MAG: hypothetical protein AVDCRST_MAG93-8480, partial [uncultured Chloroflexia bacterium]